MARGCIRAPWQGFFRCVRNALRGAPRLFPGRGCARKQARSSGQAAPGDAACAHCRPAPQRLPNRASFMALERHAHQHTPCSGDLRAQPACQAGQFRAVCQRAGSRKLAVHRVRQASERMSMALWKKMGFERAGVAPAQIIEVQVGDEPAPTSPTRSWPRMRRSRSCNRQLSSFQPPQAARAVSRSTCCRRANGAFWRFIRKRVSSSGTSNALPL